MTATAIDIQKELATSVFPTGIQSIILEYLYPPTEGFYFPDTGRSSVAIAISPAFGPLFANTPCSCRAPWCQACFWSVPDPRLTKKY